MSTDVTPPDPTRLPRRTAIAAGAGLTAMALPGIADAASEAGTESGPQTYTVTFSSADTFTVPAGVTSLSIIVEGTAGGTASPSSITGDTNSLAGASNSTSIPLRIGTPGSGARFEGTLTVTAGEELTIVAGSSATGPGRSIINEGNPNATYTPSSGGQGIGIRSDSTWLVVAGGGGGGGVGGFTYNSGNGGAFATNSNNGGNGGNAGTNGSAGVTGSSAINGGGGATSASVGAGGSGFATGPFNGNGVSGTAPTSTTLGAGGAVSANGTLAGGCGGSGYYGGGGGGSGSSDGTGAGGGGGSSYRDTGRVTATVGTSARSLADGPLVTISYTI